MSLKAFHLLFIAAAELLLFRFAGYENFRYTELTQNSVDMWTGFASSLFGILLLIYTWFFLRKTRDIHLM
jgi:hypothetical protein